MKKLLAISVLLVVVLILSGCSYSTEFVVVNDSTSPIEIEFVITSNFDSIEHTVTKPYKTSLSNWNSWFERTDWQEILQKEYEFDSQLHKAKLKLNPKEVARIAIALHHETVLITDNYEFPIKTLYLNGENDEILYSGKQFYKQFEKKGDNRYFIEYK